MLIRNAVIDGYPDPVDLRLMHGKVQEIGVGLQKGLYESEIDLEGDEVRPCPLDMALPRSARRRMTASKAAGEHIVPGSPSPLTRWREGMMIGFIDEYAAN